jgi:hemoglobin/transferrin/lactoferrin receptor protein
MTRTTILALVGGALLGVPVVRPADVNGMSLEELLKITVVTAARHEQSHFDSPRSLSVVTAEEIARKGCRSVPEALGEVAGVLVQETNYAAGSPVIRGMIGNRILILVDGVRVNNALFRLGPNQYLNTMDINQVERIEVIRGPGSVLYGSDALGGIIHIITKSSTSNGKRGPIHSRLYSRFSSADRGVSTRADVSVNAGRVGLFGGVSARGFGDVDAGGIYGRQPWTDYHEWDGDLKASVRLANNARLVAAVQHVWQDGASRPDVLKAGAELEYRWTPERRELGYLQLQAEKPLRMVDSLQLTFSRQVQFERVNRMLAAAPSVRQTYEDEVGSWGGQLQLASSLGSRQLLTYGVELYRDLVSSRRNDANLSTGAVKAAQASFADGASLLSTAAYLQDEVKLSTRLNLILGLRYSRFDLEATVTNPATGTIEIDNRPDALTGSGYLAWNLTPPLQVFGGVAQGFRAPGVEDTTVLRQSGSRFDMPSPGVHPEKSLNYEVGLKLRKRQLSGTLSYFYSDYRDLIDRAPGLFLGLPYVDLNGNGAKDASEPLVYYRANVGKARVQGFALELESRLSNEWAVYGNVAWTRGDDLTAKTSLSRIPPVKGLAGVRWVPTTKLWAEAYAILAAAQHRLSAGDIADQRIGAGGTPGFATLNLRGGLQMGETLNLTLGLENLTDKAYRWHGSGVMAPGRNLVLGVGKVF